MPLSLDTSLSLRPDGAARASDARPVVPTAEDSRAFASALARAREPAPAQAAPAPRAPTLVQMTRTRLSGNEAASALRSAWTALRGEEPSPETLSILVGQWAHETGRGASMLNYNFGGLKGAGPSGLSTEAATREGWGDNAVRVIDRFRAYGSAEEGARDYVSLLARRYPEAVGAAENGDATGFVRALKARGYFTDNEAAYAKSVQSLASLALRSGFDALGAGGGDVDAAASLPLAATPSAVRASSPELASLALGQEMDIGALLDRRAAGADGFRGPVPLAVAPSAFADEVNRAALLMSALRIGEPRPRHG